MDAISSETFLAQTLAGENTCAFTCIGDDKKNKTVGGDYVRAPSGREARKRRSGMV